MFIILQQLLRTLEESHRLVGLCFLLEALEENLCLYLLLLLEAPSLPDWWPPPPHQSSSVALSYVSPTLRLPDSVITPLSL